MREAVTTETRMLEDNEGVPVLSSHRIRRIW